MISSAVVVQVKGWQRSFQPSMKRRIALVKSLTLVKVPRRMAWRVMIPKKIPTMFGQDPEAGREVQGFPSMAEKLVAWPERTWAVEALAGWGICWPSSW
jgi:hypothetical protein